MRPGGFVCKHVASEGHPGVAALCIFHHKPVDETDSGLELVCGAEHGVGDYQLVNLDPVVAADPSIGEVLDSLQEGYQATRSAPAQPWLIEPLPAEDEAA